MHIGRLSAKLTPGVFVVEDLLIEGLTPQDRPFLKAKKIDVRLPWWTAFSRKLIIESVTMTDWDMVVESWPGGRHNFPESHAEDPSHRPEPRSRRRCGACWRRAASSPTTITRRRGAPSRAT